MLRRLGAALATGAQRELVRAVPLRAQLWELSELSELSELAELACRDRRGARQCGGRSVSCA